jgi:hypothetical protein
MNAAEIAALQTGDRLIRITHDGTDILGVVIERGERQIHVRWEGGSTGILLTTKDYGNIRRDEGK